MAKRRKKAAEVNPLLGKTVTVVARWENKEKYKDMIYEDAVKALVKFRKLGWTATLYQVGFYQPPKKAILIT